MRQRTTITLDPDVADLVRAAISTTHRRFKQVVNDAIRAGLDPARPTSRSRRSFRTSTHDPGPLRVPNLDAIQEILARAEGSEYR